eukprot:gene7873-9242_t
MSYANILRTYVLQEASALKSTKINALAMRKYMRDKFTFCGLKQPERLKIYKAFVKEHGLPKSQDDLLAVFKLPEREFTYMAIDLAVASIKKSSSDCIYKKDTDLDILFSCISKTINETEFFIQKAIGWALREYAKTDKKCVKKWVEDHPELSKLSTREALKHF